MITKCFNPACHAPFDFRAGRLVRFCIKHAAEGNSEQTSFIQHCWLCSSCSNHFTFEFKEGTVGIVDRPQILPKKSVRVLVLARTGNAPDFASSVALVS